ncbi:MAG: DUF4168 domain-containing protein [Bacteroidota bacterium]
MTSIRKFLALFAILAISTVSLTAQEVTDEQLDKFAAAYQSVQSANMEAQQQMVQVIEDHDLTPQRFNEIHQGVSDPNQEVDATDEEKKNHKAAFAEIESMNEEIQANMEKKIKAAGLSMEEYEAIVNKLQTDPELQQKLQAKFQQSQGGGQQPQGQQPQGQQPQGQR